MKPKKAQLLAFVGEKGGLGKTTLALCVAGKLTERGSRVLVLDCDENQSMACRWGQAADAGLTFDIEQNGNFDPKRVYDHDYVIFDLPGHRSPIFKSVAQVVDLMMIPCAPSIEAWGVGPTALLVAASTAPRQAAGKPPAALRVFFNRTRPGIARSMQTILELRETLAAEGISVFRTEVRDLTGLREALLQGKLPGKDDRNAFADVGLLTDEIVKTLNQVSKS